MICAAQSTGETTSAPGQMELVRANLPAGVYDVTFRLKADAGGQSITPIVSLMAGSPDYPKMIYRLVTPINFDEASGEKDFHFRLDNFKTQNIRAAVTPVQSEGTTTPKFTVEKITLAPSGSISVVTVWPGHRIYRTGEEAKGLAVLFNGTGAPQNVVLQWSLESGLHDTKEIGKQNLTLAPGERREVPVTWNAGKEEYGFGLVATLLGADGKTISQGKEYFSVADNFWKVGITEAVAANGPPGGPGPNEGLPVAQIKKYEDQLAAEVAAPIVPVDWGYCNYIEYYAWAVDDFFTLVPDKNYWYSGTGNYTMGKRQLQLAMDWLHLRGMRGIAYLNPFSCGYGGDQVYRKHPDWFEYEKDGTLSFPAFYYQKKLEVGATIGPEPAFPLHLAPYALSLAVNITTLAPIDRQVEQIVKAQKILGWDGVRFDNGMYGAYGYDMSGRPIDGNSPEKKNELEARAWAHMRDEVWKKLGKNFVIGDNRDYEFRHIMPAVWDEACKYGQLLMEEVARESWSPVSSRNRWEDYTAFYHNSGEAVRQRGGHHLLIGLDKEYAVDHLYLNIFTYAGRSHPFADQYNSQNLPLGNYAQFATRYSALLWDVERVKALPEPEKKVTVSSARPVWWKNYASVRQAPDGTRQYIVHLINPPAQERIYSDPTNKVPAPQSNVAVSLNLDKGEKISHAWLLTAEPFTHEEPLPVSTQGDTVSVTVPELHFWSTVVFE